MSSAAAAARRYTRKRPKTVVNRLEAERDGAKTSRRVSVQRRDRGEPPIPFLPCCDDGFGSVIIWIRQPAFSCHIPIELNYLCFYSRFNRSNRFIWSGLGQETRWFDTKQLNPMPNQTRLCQVTQVRITKQENNTNHTPRNTAAALLSPLTRLFPQFGGWDGTAVIFTVSSLILILPRNDTYAHP